MVKMKFSSASIFFYISCAFSCSFLLLSCQRLDSNLFEPDNTIAQYELDNYTGFRTFEVPGHWNVPSDKINLLTLTSSNQGDIAKIKAIYTGDTNQIDRDTVIMYCHGNADHMDYYWPRQKLLYNRGTFGVLNLDYRGYGLSEGTPSESGLIADVEAGLKWLKSRGLTGDRLIIYGFSLGSIPATALSIHSQNITASKLILESPIGSIRVMAEDGAILTMDPRFYTDLKTDNITAIKEHHKPFLWIHGVQDAFLAMQTHGRPIYDNHPDLPYKASILVPNGTHDDVPMKMGFGRYVKSVTAFIRR